MKLEQKYIDIATDLVEQFREAAANDSEIEQEIVLSSFSDEDLCVIQALIESSTLGKE